MPVKKMTFSSLKMHQFPTYNIELIFLFLILYNGQIIQISIAKLCDFSHTVLHNKEESHTSLTALHNIQKKIYFHQVGKNMC